MKEKQTTGKPAEQCREVHQYLADRPFAQRRPQFLQARDVGAHPQIAQSRRAQGRGRVGIDTGGKALRQQSDAVEPCLRQIDRAFLRRGRSDIVGPW